MIVLAASASARAADPAPAAPADTAAPAAPADAAPAATASPEEKPAHYAEQKHTSNYDVLAVEPETRIVVLREDGDDQPQSFQVSKDVQRLDQVKAGDRLKVDAIESVSIRLVPPGEEVKDNQDVAEIARSKPGEQLSGVASRKRTKTATVSSIFPGSKEFMTRDAKGKLSTWTVKDAKELEGLKSGDRLQLTYTTAWAASVSPAPPKPTTTTAPTAGNAAAPAAGATAQPAAAEQPAQPAPAPAQAPTPP
jgi:hypothetical protein